jgi:hypothetical protein
LYQVKEGVKKVHSRSVKGFNDTADHKNVDFIVVYLGEFEFIFEKADLHLKRFAGEGPGDAPRQSGSPGCVHRQVGGPAIGGTNPKDRPRITPLPGRRRRAVSLHRWAASYQTYNNKPFSGLP